MKLPVTLPLFFHETSIYFDTQEVTADVYSQLDYSTEQNNQHTKFCDDQTYKDDLWLNFSAKLVYWLT